MTTSTARGLRLKRGDDEARAPQEAREAAPSLIQELVADLEFAIDVTEPRDVILRRFADILERSRLWR